MSRRHNIPLSWVVSIVQTPVSNVLLPLVLHNARHPYIQLPPSSSRVSITRCVSWVRLNSLQLLLSACVFWANFVRLHCDGSTFLPNPTETNVHLEGAGCGSGADSDTSDISASSASSPTIAHRPRPGALAKAGASKRRLMQPQCLGVLQLRAAVNTARLVSGHKVAILHTEPSQYPHAFHVSLCSCAGSRLQSTVSGNQTRL